MAPNPTPKSEEEFLTSLRRKLTSLRKKFKKALNECEAKEEPRIRRLHCRRDLEEFARYFFPHLFRLEFSPKHLDLFLQRIPLVSRVLAQRAGRRVALAAPRGNAKSTIQTLLFPLHDLCYGLEKYTVIFSATMAQAEQRLRNIRRELEKNQALRAAYGDALAKTGRWTRRSLCVGGAQIDAFSAGSETRGISSGEWRPTKVILDDAEDSEQVENADLREKLYDWFREVIENLGDRYTDIEVVGTVLHPDSLLARLLERPDFESKRWPSILHFAERTDLWDEWRARYTDLANPRRTASARRFFNDRREEMLRGAEVLWPPKEDYYDLMVQLATRGRRAFFKEKQNEPLRADSAVFDPSTFRFFRREGDRLRVEGQSEGVAIADLRVVGFLDLAMGQGARRGEGDFAAIATVGADAGGRLYALDVWLERATPSEQARRVFAQHDLWNYSVFGIEAIGFQGLIREPLESIRRERRNSGTAGAAESAGGARAAELPIRDLTPRGSKVERVASLEPLIHNGWLVFDRALPEEFFAQLEQFPRGRHDDGPDALASAVDLARHGDGQPQLLRKTRNGTKTGGF